MKNNRYSRYLCFHLHLGSLFQQPTIFGETPQITDYDEQKWNGRDGK